MKKSLSICLMAILSALTLSACAGKTASEKGAEPDEEKPSFENTNNLNFMISGDHEGDADGPAYVIYSKPGVNKGSIDVKISQVKLNLTRKDDNQGINAYAFLGVDVYKDENCKSWVNCVDAGLCNCGDTPGWHLFCNRYTCNEGDGWYESDKMLDDSHDYRIVLDSSKADEQFTVSIYDITDDMALADEMTFDLPYTSADGKNTVYYQDYALDYPDDVKYTPEGEFSSTDWAAITEYNSDQGVFMDNLIIENALLWKDSKETKWTADETWDRYLWPNIVHPGPDYICTQIEEADQDTYLVLNLDLNRGHLAE